MFVIVLGATVFFLVAAACVFATIAKPGDEPAPLFPLFADYRWNGWPTDDDEEIQHAA